MLSFLTGLLAGIAHIITGPDHWIAVAPLSVIQPKHSISVGIRWGMGHAVGILTLGALGLYLKELLSLESVSSIAEGVVGVVLVITGFWALHRSETFVIHSHPHTHSHDDEDASHEHVHLHIGDTTHEDDKAHRNHVHAAFGFGILHGMAGASQLWTLIPTLALPTEAAIAYLCAFLISSVMTMGVFTYLVGHWVRRGQVRLDWIFKVTGWGSIVFGSYWVSLATTAS